MTPQEDNYYWIRRRDNPQLQLIPKPEIAKFSDGAFWLCGNDKYFDPDKVEILKQVPDYIR